MIAMEGGGRMEVKMSEVSCLKKIGYSLYGIIPGMFLGGALTAYFYKNWTGVVTFCVSTLLTVAVVYLILRILLKWGTKLREQLRVLIHKPIEVVSNVEDHQKYYGVASVSLAALFIGLGGGEKALTLVQELDLHPTYSDQLLQIPEESLGINDLPTDGLLDLDDGNLVEIEVGGADRDGGAIPLIGDTAIPVYALIGGVKSIWRNGKEIMTGQISLGQGFRNTGADLVTAIGSGAIFSGGIRLAGMVISTSTGTYPIILASGILANLATSPLLLQLNRFLRGDRLAFTQRMLQKKLKKLGKEFRQSENRVEMVGNIHDLVAELETEIVVREAQAKPTLRSLFFPKVEDLLQEEYLEHLKEKQEKTQEYATRLEAKIERMVVQRKDYPLGELVYLNRSLFLKENAEEFVDVITDIENVFSKLSELREEAESHDGRNSIGEKIMDFFRGFQQKDKVIEE